VVSVKTNVERKDRPHLPSADRIKFLRRLRVLSKHKFSRFFEGRRRYHIVLLSLINIIILFSAFVFYKYTNILRGHERIYIFGVIMGVITLTMLIWTILWRIVDYAQREVEWKEREDAYKKQLFYIKNMEEAMHSIRAQRHDFKNHISCIYGLLMLEKNKEALEYTKRFTNQIVQYDGLLDTGNSIVTSLLNMKLMKANSENIPFEISVDLPDHIKLDMLDISIVLGNLLDNAIEACTPVNENDRFKVNIGNFQDHFTTKNESMEEHGYGLYNIQQIVNKYHGRLKIEDNEDTFHVNRAIPLTDA